MPFKCVLCGKKLPYKDNSAAVEHFSTHVWVNLQDIKQEKDKSQLHNACMAKLPLNEWISHHQLVEQDKKAFCEQVSKKVKDIIAGKWCCICLDHFDDHFFSGG